MTEEIKATKPKRKRSRKKKAEETPVEAVETTVEETTEEAPAEEPVVAEEKVEEEIKIEEEVKEAMAEEPSEEEKQDRADAVIKEENAKLETPPVPTKVFEPKSQFINCLNGPVKNLHGKKIVRVIKTNDNGSMRCKVEGERHYVTILPHQVIEK